jgi:4'-phosphopantetheinyl transferase
MAMRAAALSEQLWKPPPADLELPSDDVHVWRAALDLPAPALQSLGRTLAPGEAERAGRIRDPARRERLIAAHGLLRAILCRYLNAEPGQLCFRRGQFGKPALAGAGDLRFNLAHSHGLAIYAVARGRELGVDLERIRSAGDWDRLATRYLAASERAAVRALPARECGAAFFTFWVCKEAYLKAIGTGLAQPLGKLAIAIEKDGMAVVRGDTGACWSIQVLPFERGYAAALAAQGHGWRLRYWEWPADTQAYSHDLRGGGATA